MQPCPAPFTGTSTALGSIYLRSAPQQAIFTASSPSGGWFLGRRRVGFPPTVWFRCAWAENQAALYPNK
eukprot:8028738-Pyramimonas_sp.AAC.1